MGISRRRDLAAIKVFESLADLGRHLSSKYRSYFHLDSNWAASRYHPLLESLEDRNLLDAATWQYLGPQPLISDAGVSLSGIAMSLAVINDPRGGNRVESLLAGTDSGGVWRTTNLTPESLDFANTPNWTPVGDNLYTDNTLESDRKGDADEWH